MIRHRYLWAGLAVLLGALQAWDSGALNAGPLAQSLILATIAILGMGIAVIDRYELHTLTIGLAVALLTIARVVSPVTLNTLHLIVFAPAIIIFGSKAMRRGGASAA